MSNLSFAKRLLMIAAVAAIQSLYVPTSQNGTGGIAPKLALDIFPVYPIWVVIYVLCFPLWFFCIFWAIRNMEDRLFREFVAAAFFTLFIGVSTFILFPTYVELPKVNGSDFFSELLRQIQVLGGSYDALPSGHLYITTLISLFFTRWYPRGRLFWAITVVVVGLSTLFTGQHYILDVITGIGLAWLGYKFGLWWVMEKWKAEPAVE